MEKSKVVLKKSGSYAQDGVYKCINEAFDSLGGLAGIIKPAERVLIKPNLLSERNPEEGVTTHPEIVRAVIREVKKITDRIELGDSPGGVGKNIDMIYDKTGMRRLAEQENIGLIKFDKSKLVNGFPVSTAVLEADKVISVPKFKTHNVTVITSALKNSYGFVPGLFKARMHAEHPNGADFSRVVCDVFGIRPPDLVVIDAVVAMDGNGPAAGDLKNLGVIAVSTDAVAADSVMCRIAGIDPKTVPSITLAQSAGLGSFKADDIEMVGDPIETLKNKSFRKPPMYVHNSLPSKFSRFFTRFINFSVFIDRRACVRCGLCAEACPADAISGESPEVDKSKCILCLCCQEVCPKKAVKIRRSLPARLIWG
jgi:uncharacterized protein (DUF362 family)